MNVGAQQAAIVVARATQLVEAKVVNVANVKKATRIRQQHRKIRLRQFNEMDQDVLYNIVESNLHEELNLRDVNRFTLKIVNLLQRNLDKL